MFRRPLSHIIYRVLLALVLASGMLVITSFIPRKGNYVINGTRFGDPAYRDVRGMPFVFLKRSLADGECDIRDAEKHICNPMVGNEPHELNTGYLTANAVVWLGASAVLVALAPRVREAKQQVLPRETPEQCKRI